MSIQNGVYNFNFDFYVLLKAHTVDIKCSYAHSSVKVSVKVVPYLLTDHEILIS